jgi:hypothetical protein
MTALTAKRVRNPSFETRAGLKTRSQKADTAFVDAAERKEILNRYRDHSRRFEAAAARRGSTRTGSVIPFAPAAQREFEQEPTAREIEVLQLVADGLVNRRSCWLPAWAHCLVTRRASYQARAGPATTLWRDDRCRRRTQDATASTTP